MPPPDRNSQKENKPRGNEPSFNWRGVVLIAIAFALIGLAVLPFLPETKDQPLPE